MTDKKRKKESHVGSLKASDYNPRSITDERLDILGKSMREFGDLSGIIKNRKTGNLIGGHQRLKHFNPDWPISLQDAHDDTGTVAVGYIDTPFGKWSYREVDWDESREKAANIAANRHGGEFDTSMLSDILSEIDTSLLPLTGFNELELSDIMGQPEDILEYEEKDIRPYRMTHILISFPPEKLIDIKEHLESIIAVEGVEYEQG